VAGSSKDQQELLRPVYQENVVTHVLLLHYAILLEAIGLLSSCGCEWFGTVSWGNTIKTICGHL
jgi:hypothetical protein